LRVKWFFEKALSKVEMNENVKFFFHHNQSRHPILVLERQIFTPFTALRLPVIDAVCLRILAECWLYSAYCFHHFIRPWNINKSSRLGRLPISNINTHETHCAYMRIRVTKQSFNVPQKLFSFNGCCKWHADTKAFETLKKNHQMCLCYWYFVWQQLDWRH